MPLEFHYILAFFISSSATFLLLPKIITEFQKRKILGKDMNKEDQQSIPEMGGIGVIFGFFTGILFLFVYSFVLSSELEISTFQMVSLLTILLIACTGIYDDIFIMRQRTKAVLPFIFALPLGFFVSSEMPIPVIGEFDFGLAIIFIIPFGITCAANSMNMLEGFNGLGTGLGIIITLSLIIMSINNNLYESLFFLVPLLGSLLSFFYFNKYPSKIFPGDTLTLFVGGIIGCAAILSNLKIEGAILMTPMIIEFFLKLRGRFQGECFATGINKGILDYDGRVESLTHFVMKNFEVTESKLVIYFFILETILCTLVIILNYLDKL